MKPQNHFDYIHNCVKNGIKSFPQIHQNIKREIQELNERLASVEDLRIKRNELIKIENEISAMLRTDNIADRFEDDSEEMKEIRNKIYEVISNKNGLSNRDIITKLCDMDSSLYGMDAKIIRCIKHLADQGVLDKNSDRLIVQGINWEKFKNNLN